MKQAYFIILDEAPIPGHPTPKYALMQGDPDDASGFHRADGKTIRELLRKVPAGEPVYRVYLARTDGKEGKSLITRRNPSSRSSIRGVSTSELRRGVKVEMEHTRKRDVARKIAIDHLSEDPRYYSKLAKIHPGSKKPMYFIEGFTPFLRRGKVGRRISGFRSSSLEAARKHADRIFQKYGIVVAITKENPRRRCKGTKSAPVGSPRQRAFCARMGGMLRKRTSLDVARDPKSCIRKSLRRWKCRGFLKNPRVFDQGAFVRVTVSANEVYEFKSRWPGSELPDRSISFTFQKSNGDLVDLSPSSVDGSDALALSQDAWEYARKRLKLNPLTSREQSELRSEARSLRRAASASYERGDVRGGVWSDGKASGLAYATYWYGQKKKGRRRNPGAFDAHAATELELFIENDADLYRQQYTPILKNLILKRAKGIFDPQKAAKLFMYLMESGAKKYARQYGSSERDWHMIFSKPTREHVARRFVQSFIAEADLGNYDGLLPKKYRKNPRHMSRAAQDFISSEISGLMRKGYPQKRAIAAAYSMARSAGYKVPARNGARRSRGGSPLVATPAKLEAEKVASWIARSGIPAWVSPHKGQWAVMVAPSSFSEARHLLGKVLSRNPGFLEAVVTGVGFGVGAGAFKMAGRALSRGKRRCNPAKCSNPKHRHQNPLLQAVTLAGMNPPRCPFRDGQRIPVAKARAWVVKTGNRELLRQFDEAYRLQCKANRKPKYVTWRTLAIGDPKRLEMVTAAAHYGDTPETVYKPPKGSKKGTATYIHKWGEGTGRSRPVPVLATPGGKALIMPLSGKSKVDDWMRH